MSHAIIAIDGPAAAGKGTLARRIAAVLNLPYLDTGLLYRAVARRVLDGAGDAEAAARALGPADFANPHLRTPEVDREAAAIASRAAVRAALLDFQRDFAARAGAVLDGRDIGTVIFPHATAKLFVTASVEARAGRRWRELRGRGVIIDLATVRQEIEARDAADRARAAAPLRPAEDAIILDTTLLDADAAFAAAMNHLRARGVA